MKGMKMRKSNWKWVYHKCEYHKSKCEYYIPFDMIQNSKTGTLCCWWQHQEVQD